MKTLDGLHFFPPPGSELDMADVRLCLRQVLNIPFIIDERFDKWAQNFNRLKTVRPQRAVPLQHEVVVVEDAPALDLQIAESDNDPIVYVLYSQARHQSKGNQRGGGVC